MVFFGQILIAAFYMLYSCRPGFQVKIAGNFMLGCADYFILRITIDMLFSC